MRQRFSLEQLGDRQHRRGAGGVVVRAVIDLPAPDAQVIVVSGEHQVAAGVRGARNQGQQIDPGARSPGQRKGMFITRAERRQAERLEPSNQVTARPGGSRGARAASLHRVGGEHSHRAEQRGGVGRIRLAGPLPGQRRGAHQASKRKRAGQEAGAPDCAGGAPQPHGLPKWFVLTRIAPFSWPEP